MTHRPAKQLLATLFATCAALAAGCGGGATSLDAPGLRVAIAPIEVDVGVGSSIPLRATVTATDEGGAANRAVIWTALDSAIVSVSSEGVVTGRAVGHTRVFATVPGYSAEATVHVVAPVVASVAVSPSSATIATGGTRQFVAGVRDAAGSDRSDRTVFWSSDNEAVATVSPFTGVVTARAAGSANIAASVDGKTGRAAVTVNATGTPAPVANQAPTANFTVACTALACTFTDASTDADGSVTGWSWSFGDGGSAVARNAAHAFAAAGTFAVTLTVTDNGGATASATKSVSVAAPRGPTASFAASCTNLVCAFTDRSTAAGGGSVVAWVWELGSPGATSPFRNPDNWYPAPGSYAVKLTVTDEQGRTATTTRTITVASSPEGVRLVNRASGECMSVDTRDATRGSPITVRGCDGGNDQQFATPGPETAGPLQLVRYTDRFVWLERFTDQEHPLLSWTWHGGTAQRWTYTPTGQLRNMVTDTCILPVSGRRSLQTAPCDASLAQQWERRP